MGPHPNRKIISLPKAPPAPAHTNGLYKPAKARLARRRPDEARRAEKAASEPGRPVCRRKNREGSGGDDRGQAGEARGARPGVGLASSDISARLRLRFGAAAGDRHCERDLAGGEGGRAHTGRNQSSPWTGAPMRPPICAR